MAAYMIGYDLNKEGSAYSEANKRLTDRIKQVGQTWWHHLDSTWIVVSAKSAVDIRDDLLRYVDRDAEILVARIGPEAAWYGFNESGSAWLKQHL